MSSSEPHQDAAPARTGLRWRALPWVVWAASLLVATAHVASHPEWNLDVVFYAALMQPERASNEELHARVYAELARALPTEQNEALARGSAYRRQVSESAPVFALQLPFYRSKPLYLWLGRALCRLGVSSVSAPNLLSAGAFLALGALIPLLAWQAGAGALAAWLGALAVWLPSLRELGALATPDALASALIVGAAASSLSRARLAIALSCLAVLARPDLAFLALAVLGAAWYRSRTRELAAGALLVALTALAVMPASGGYGWPTVIRHTFLGRLVSDEDMLRGLSWRAYLKALGRGVNGYMTSRPAGFAPYLALAALAFWRALGRDGVQRQARALLAAIWFAAGLRFLALPLLADRMFAPAYVCTLALAPALLLRPSAHCFSVRGEQAVVA